MKLLLTLWLLIHFYSIKAADNYPVGARSAGVAHASVTYTDEWSSFHNQAGLAFIKEASAAMYFENKFLLPDLSVKAFTVAVPFPKAGTFSFSATVFGDTLYNEKKAGIGYAKKLGQHFSAGVQLDYLSTLLAEEYGNRNLFSAEAGLLAEPIRKLKIGIHVFNPNNTRLADYGDEHVPVIMRFGASYEFSSKVLLSAEEEKDIDRLPSFKSGLEYHPVDALYVRCGIAGNPTLSTFGFGLRTNRFMLDMASSWHQELGFSPQISLGYFFK